LTPINFRKQQQQQTQSKEQLRLTVLYLSQYQSATFFLVISPQGKMKYSFFLFTIALASSCPSSLAFTFLPKSQRCFSLSPLHMADTSSRAVVTRLPDSAVEIQIPVPGSATKAAYEKVAAELSKTIAVPGFRKGSKIPPQVLEQAMSAKGGRNALKVQAINELLRELVEPTLKQENLDPIGQATLLTPAETLAETYVPGQDITLPVRCDVWPEIKFSGPYTGLKGSYTRKPFNQEKLEKALFDLKERYATLETIEDVSYALQMGDACTVNMEGYMGNADGSKGEPLPNAASGENVEVILGPGRYMEGLVEGLVGAKVGETRTVSVAFPEVGRV
jgi:trigger factor